MQSENFESLCDLATYGGSLEQVRSLIEGGADINEKDFCGWPPLLLSAFYENKEILHMLIKCGADLQCCTMNKRTVLHFATEKKWEDTIMLLIDHNVDLNVKDFLDMTPLLLAANNGNKEIVNLLIKSGADLLCCDNRKKPAIHYALAWGWEDTVQSLLKKGAYVESYDYEELLLEWPFFNDMFLKDIALCAQSIINQYNLKHLPALYGMTSVTLPSVAKLRVKEGSWMAEEVEKALGRQKREKGSCNLVEVRPLVLRMLCVQSFINYGNIYLRNQEKPTIHRKKIRKLYD